VPDESPLAEVEGPRGTAEIFEVPRSSDRRIEVDYAVVFGSERVVVPSLGEAHILANQLTGLNEESN
jgi:hypothetical protein